MKRALKIAGIIIGVIALLLVGGSALAYLLIDLDKVLNEQVAKAKPEIEAKLGRKVSVGEISTRFFPTLGGTVSSIEIAPAEGRAEDDRPLLRVGSIGFDIAIWRAILSGGDEVVIDAAYLDGLAINFIRYKDGSLSYQDILDKLAAAEPAQDEPKEEKPSEPMSPEVQAWLEKVSINELRLADAQIRLVDHATATGQPAESFVRKLGVRLNDVRLSDPIRVKVEAAVFADAPNFAFETSVGPLPPDLAVEGLPKIGGVKLRLDKVDLSRIAPYLGPAVPARIDSALASADWTVGAIDPGKPISINGFLSIANLQLGGGAKFELRVDSKLEADLERLGAKIEKLDVQVGAVKLAMAGALEDLGGRPKFKNFTVRSTSLDPSVLLSYYPAAKASLPPGARLEGPIALDVKASGDANKQTVRANVDMAALDLLIPDTLLKPKGTPMGVSVDGDFTATDATLRGLALRLDELDLQLSGTVKDFSSPALDLKLGAKPFSFDRLARLLPAANTALAASGAKASGNGSLAGHLKGTAANLDAALQLALLDVKLDIPGTRLDGDLRFEVTAKGNPEKDLKASLLLDADKAVIEMPELVSKKAATPLLVKVTVDRAGDRIDVRNLDVQLAELKLGAKGGFDLAKGDTDLRVEMAKLDLERFAKTVTAIPAAQAKKGFVDAKLAVSGNPNQLESMTVAIDPINARFGESDLRGQIRVTNLLAPQAELRLSSTNLDLDALLGDGASEQKPAEPAKQEQAAKPPAQDDPSLKDYRFTGTFDLKRIVVSETELRDFRGDVRLADGKLRLEDCTFGVFGGTVTAKGTEAEIWKGRMPFRANLSIKGLDVNQALSAKTKYPDTLHGKADLAVELAGEGFETAELEEKLLGKVAVALNEGKFARASLTQAVVGDFSALEKVPGLSLKPIQSENAIRNMAADFEVRDGRFTLKKPMTLTLDGSKVVLTGAIGIAGKLFLQGDYFMAPAVVNKLTAGKCQSNEELKIPVAIGGTVDEPSFTPNGASIALSLAQRCLAGKAGEVAEKLLGDKAKQVLGVSSKEEAEAKARAEAERLKAETEAKARAEADRLKKEAEAKAKAEADRLKAEAEARARAEAERRKEEAKKKAEEEAKKGLKNLFGK